MIQSPESVKEAVVWCLSLFDDSKLLRPKSGYRRDYTGGALGFKSGGNGAKTGGIQKSERA
ncbi:hypothetical protein GCM10028807_32070 [Spirosoma daeguense]